MDGNVSDVGVIAQLGLLMTKPSFRFDFAYVLAIFVLYLVCTVDVLQICSI